MTTAAEQMPEAFSWQQNHEAFMAFMREASPIAFLVNQEMRRGKKFSQALDFICGEGSFKQFAKEIYVGARSRSFKAEA